MTDAKRVGRICVWPSYEIAIEEDTEVSNVLRRMTVWPSEGLARENTTSGGGGGGGTQRAGAARFAGAGIQSINAAKPWSPADLGAELHAWFPFDRLSGSNADPVGNLVDASGNGRHSGASTGTDRGTLAVADLNGRNTLRFPGPGQYNWGATTGTSLLYTSQTAGSLYIVVKGATPPGGNDYGLLNFGANAQADHWPDTDGQIKTDFGSTSRMTCGTPPALTSYRIFSIWSAANDWAMLESGNAFFATASSTVGWRATDQWLGQGTNSRFTGWVAEAIFTNAKQSTLNRQKAEGYLAHKWGLTGTLDAGHPYKSIAP